MLPSTVPLTDRIVIALDQLRLARASADDDALTREVSWQEQLDALLERYGNGQR